MSYVSFVNDADFEALVGETLQLAINVVTNDESNLHKNVIDPMAVLFQMHGFSLTHDNWLRAERTRQNEKTLQNHIGEFHQKFLGLVSAWTDLGTGKNNPLDLECHHRQIIAEIKNKYNTVSGGQRYTYYDSFHDMVMPTTSKYYGYTAYYVEVIPSRPKRYDKFFTPSHSPTKTRRPENKLIRQIDGASFYSLVTGVDNALAQTFRQIPNVIAKVAPKYALDLADVESIMSYYEKAYIKK